MLCCNAMSDRCSGIVQVQAQAEYYDALIVAVGCYFEPNLPALPGMDATPAFQMHSHNYRSAERFAGQTVLVVGASFSGADGVKVHSRSSDGYRNVSY